MYQTYREVNESNQFLMELISICLIQKEEVELERKITETEISPIQKII